MGLMRLTVGDWARIPEDFLPRIFVAGPDELPFAGRTYRSGDQLIIERRDDSSGCVWVPWSSPASENANENASAEGQWLVGTATLMERDAPYQLEVELARGAVYRLRNQLATWVQLGLQSNESLDTQVAEATQLFSRAASRQDDLADCLPLAEQAITLAGSASIALTALYAEQAMAVRQAATAQLPTLLGFAARGELPQEAGGPLGEAFSTIALPCAWNAVEASEGKRRWKAIDAQFAWAKQTGMRVCAGPLIEFHDRSIPDWAYLWEGDFEALSALMITHVETVVARYRGRVQLWHVASRINRRNVLGLSDEQRLQLVARAVRAIRETEDPQGNSKTPIVVSLDQPWGEYLLDETSDLAPIDFADALERADLGIAGFGLELNLGYTPDGTSARNPLDYSRLLDYWSMRLELPLMLSITAPSSAGDDPQASPKLRVAAGDALAGQAQSTWITQCLPMLLAKNCVQVVLWNGHRDDQPHLYPHGGLYGMDGQAKPALAELQKLRAAYLV